MISWNPKKKISVCPQNVSRLDLCATFKPREEFKVV